MPLGMGGHPLQVNVVSATPGIFSVLSAEPQLGRAFTPQEAQPGREHVVVLMNDLWRTQFHSDPAILGKNDYAQRIPVHRNRRNAAVLSSARNPDHSGSRRGSREDQSQALVLMAFSKDQLEEAMGDFNYFGLARLKPGVSVAQASAEINSCSTQSPPSSPP